jgi:glycosyltransferase involved in cell wall biosynthesis
MNPFEMQSYAPLASTHDLTGYAACNNQYELNDIGFPIKKLHIMEEYYANLMWPLNSLVYGALLPYGMNYRMFGLEKELRGEDILHAAETYNGYSYQCARVRKAGGKKLVLTVWENIPFQSVRTFKGLTDNERIVDFVKGNTDMFIAVTGRAKKALEIEGIAEEKIKVIPAGIDVSRFNPADPDTAIMEKLGISDGDFVVLFIGRLTREKGVYDLLHAAKLASLDGGLENVKIVFAGSGPEKERLIRLSGKLKVEKYVKFAGSFSYVDMPKLYNAADVFILPSIPVSFWQEQFGMVLVEAMASGLPIISTLSGSIPEVLGEGGILIQPNDPLSIYREIKKLLLDDAFRAGLGLMARKRAEDRFNLPKVSRMIESAYGELG